MSDDEDKTQSISDAMIAEMEASIYGLQVLCFCLFISGVTCVFLYHILIGKPCFVMFFAKWLSLTSYGGSGGYNVSLRDLKIMLF